MKIRLRSDDYTRGIHGETSFVAPTFSVFSLQLEIPMDGEFFFLIYKVEIEMGSTDVGVFPNSFPI